jgi:hypothetical protein
MDARLCRDLRCMQMPKGLLTHGKCWVRNRGLYLMGELKGPGVINASAKKGLE